MADHSDLIAKFQSLTGANTDIAKSYLESCAWNCDEAIGSFFEEDNPMDDSPDLNKDDDLESMDIIEPPSTRDKKIVKPTSTRDRISTLSSLKKNEEDNDSSEEEGQAFYAGGPNAGQQILGPKRDKNDIRSVFFKAKEHGAEVIDKSEYEKQKNHKGKQKAFQGQAYRLGDSIGPSEVIGIGSGSGAGRSGTTSREIDTVLTFWSNGFTVNHGPLRDPADPDNALFLAQIKLGQVPKELVQEAKGSKVNLMMEDCSQQDYHSIKKKTPLFGGAGHRLGSPSAIIESDAPKTQTESNVDKAEDTNEENKKEKVEDRYTIAVDDSLPTTSIQIRLPDGSRHVLKLNHSHTVQDIRNFVVNTRTDLASIPFILLSSFPRQQLSQDSKSISEANLINALVIVKLS